jgi:hypothetical protein
MTPELREQASRAIQIVTFDGRRLSAGRAILFVLEEIGWHPTLSRLGQHRPFIWLIELGYSIVERFRLFFGRFLFRSE